MGEARDKVSEEVPSEEILAVCGLAMKFLLPRKPSFFLLRKPSLFLCQALLLLFLGASNVRLRLPGLRLCARFECSSSGSNPSDGGPDSRESGRTVAGRIRQPDAKLMFDNFASKQS